MTTDTTTSRARHLASLLTQHDAKQTGKRGYNHNALPLYLQAVHAWEADARSAYDPVVALGSYFTANPADPEDFCITPVRQFVREIKAGKI